MVESVYFGNNLLNSEKLSCSELCRIIPPLSRGYTSDFLLAMVMRCF